MCRKKNGGVVDVRIYPRSHPSVVLPYPTDFQTHHHWAVLPPDLHLSVLSPHLLLPQSQITCGGTRPVEVNLTLRHQEIRIGTHG